MFILVKSDCQNEEGGGGGREEGEEGKRERGEIREGGTNS
jgi:hypothetical protein